MKTLKFIGFGRVSGHAQIDNTSLDRQEEEVRRYLAGGPHTLIDWVEPERGYETGYYDADRTTWRSVLLRLHRREADGLIVHNLKRFSRYAATGLLIFDMFRRKGLHIISIEEGLDTTQAWVLPKQIVAYQLVNGESDRDNIVRQLSAAKQICRNRGQYTGGRVGFGKRVIEVDAPPGYGRKKKVRIVVDDKDMRQIWARIRLWIAQKHTLQWCADRLNEMNVPGPAFGKWTRQYVSKVYHRDMRRGRG